MTIEKRNKRNPFAMPCTISKEMSLFMKKNGEPVLRLEVTQYVIDYIKMNGLSERSKIYPDETLSNLLGTNELTYYHLDKYIKMHIFVKPSL